MIVLELHNLIALMRVVEVQNLHYDSCKVIYHCPFWGGLIRFIADNQIIETKRDIILTAHVAMYYSRALALLIVYASTLFPLTI